MVTALVWENSASFREYIERMRMFRHHDHIEPEIIVALAKNAPTLEIVPPCGGNGRVERSYRHGGLTESHSH